MQAAVLHVFGQTPRYEEFPDPVPGHGELLVHVKAVALENVDRAMAAGTHFASRQFLDPLPAIVGFDGIGQLEDGRLVGFGGVKAPYGAMAELTVIPEGYFVPVPEDVVPEMAAALPPAALAAYLPLKFAAGLQPGQTVLINGATGVAGQLSVQVAKLLGAGRVIGTGRDPASLQRLPALGADVVIDLKLPEAEVAAALAQAAGQGVDVVVDFLWGRPAELIIAALSPQSLGLAERRIRLVQVGEMAGASLTLPAGALRTSGLEICGATAGLAPEAFPAATEQVWAWLRAGQLHVTIERVPLRDIEAAWGRTDLHGARQVVVV